MAGTSRGAEPAPEGNQRGARADAEHAPVPEQDPGPSWFLSVLADAPRGLPYTIGCIYHRMYGQLV
jgi:hypothetical protein